MRKHRWQDDGLTIEAIDAEDEVSALWYSDSAGNEFQPEPEGQRMLAEILRLAEENRALKAGMLDVSLEDELHQRIAALEAEVERKKAERLRVGVWTAHRIANEPPVEEAAPPLAFIDCTASPSAEMVARYGGGSTCPDGEVHYFRNGACIRCDALQK